MSRFANFARLDFPYRTINGVPLMATILTPLSIATATGNGNKRYPVMVYWHGGGFIVGHRLYEPWFSQWLLDLALDREAIIITADHRLLPESNGSDVISDVAHFWRWMQRDLSCHVEQKGLPGLDLCNILCCGESSGGFISVYCGLHLDTMLQDTSEEEPTGSTLRIRAVVSISAPLDDTDPDYRVPRPRVFMGKRPPPPRQALAKIRGYIDSMPRGSIRTGCEPSADMWELFLCMAQQNCLPRLLGLRGGKEEQALESIMETLDRGVKPMVPVWVVHGRDDTMLPSICSTGFVNRLRDVQPEVPVHLSLCPGDHLFYVNAARDTEWVREGMAFLGEYWPLPISGQISAQTQMSSM